MVRSVLLDSWSPPIAYEGTNAAIKKTSSNHDGCMLLSLPLEIREMIYSYTCNSIVETRDANSQGLLLACKQTRDEVLPMFVQKATFVDSLNRGKGFRDPRTAIPPEPYYGLLALRSVQQIWWGFGALKGYDDHVEIGRFFSVLARAPLRTPGLKVLILNILSVLDGLEIPEPGAEEDLDLESRDICLIKHFKPSFGGELKSIILADKRFRSVLEFAKSKRQWFRMLHRELPFELKVGARLPRILFDHEQWNRSKIIVNVDVTEAEVHIGSRVAVVPLPLAVDSGIAGKKRKRDDSDLSE